MSDNERRFRKLAAEGNIKAIRRRCQQLRDEIEDGLVLHASFEIEDAGEALYRKLAEAEAMAARLRGFVAHVEKNLPIIHWRKAHDEWLHPGDLDAPGDGDPA